MKAENPEEKKSFLAKWKAKWTPRNKIEKRISLSRALVFCSIAISGLLLSFFSSCYLMLEEESSFKAGYEALSGDFMLKVENKLRIAHMSSSALAGMIGLIHRDSWPFVWVDGFDELYNTGSSSAISLMGITPIVMRDQVDSYNIFSINHTSRPILDPSTRLPYNETTGYFGENASVTNIILPLLHVAPSMFSGMTGIDAFSNGKTQFNGIISCLNEKKNLSYSNASIEKMEACSSLSSIESGEEFIVIPTFFLVNPILGIDGNGEGAVAFLHSSISLDSLLTDLAPINMPPVVCVMEKRNVIGNTEGGMFSFEISADSIIFLGDGDFHDHSFNEFERSAFFSLDTDVTNSSSYSVKFFPSSEFRSSYRSNTPLLASLIFIVVTVVVLLIYLAYDRAVATESFARGAILVTKKNFIRYISHEIRTPLNTVLLGLDVLHIADHINSSASNNKLSIEKLSIYKDIIDIVEEVKTGAAKAVTVLNDLLDYDRVDMSRMKIQTKPIPAVRFLSATISNLRSQLIDNAHLTNVTFTSNIFASENPLNASDVQEIHFGNHVGVPVDKVYLLGDMYRLAQVIKHLLSNALKYVPYDGHVNVSVNWKDVGLSGKCHSLRYRKVKYASDFEIYENYESNRCGVVSIQVRDNGPGISKEFINEIFTDEIDFDTRLGRSKGLGLCLSKHIMSLHHGHIWASSHADDTYSCSDSNSLIDDDNFEEKTGSTFTIELPVYCLSDIIVEDTSVRHLLCTPEPSHRKGSISVTRDSSSGVNPSKISTFSRTPSTTYRKLSSVGNSETEDGEQSEVFEPSNKNKNFNPPIRIVCKYNKILVVDDSHPSRKIVCKVLGRHGFSTDQAVDGLECLEIMAGSQLNLTMEDDENLENSIQYDCILLDSEMPNMSGPRAARKLRSLGHKLPIIGLTGNVLSDDVAHFLQSGVNHVMFKPFKFENFNKMIHRDTGSRTASEMSDAVV